jgi:hypothetical protein
MQVLRTREDQPLILGAIKSNLGHLEAAAGFAGLIKSIMNLDSSTFTPNIHLLKLNPHLDVEGFPVIFPSDALGMGASELVGGVSSFGFGGTNSHAIYRRAAAAATRPPPDEAPRLTQARNFKWRRILQPLFCAPMGTHDCGTLSHRHISPLSMRVFRDHRVFGTVVLPGASHLGLFSSSRLETAN